jgi:hypothetical protein
MDIEIELALEVMRAKLAKVSFVPDDDVRCANFVEPCPAGEEGIYSRCDVFLILKNELFLLDGRSNGRKNEG